MLPARIHSELHVSEQLFRKNQVTAKVISDLNRLPSRRWPLQGISDLVTLNELA